MKYDEFYEEMHNAILKGMGVPLDLQPGPKEVEEAADEAADGSFKYEDPKTGEIFIFKRKGIYKKNGRTLVPLQ